MNDEILPVLCFLVAEITDIAMNWQMFKELGLGEHIFASTTFAIPIAILGGIFGMVLAVFLKMRKTVNKEASR